MTRGFNVAFELTDYAGEVLLNDVPLVVSALDPPLRGSLPASAWVVEGTNHLRIVVSHSAAHPEARGSAPSAEPFVADLAMPPRAVARVVEGVVGQIATSEPLAAAEWLPPDLPFRLPASATATFVVAGQPRWAWQDAARLEPRSSEERARVVSFLREVHDDLVHRRFDDFVERFRSRIDEMPALRGLSPDEARTKMVEDLGGIGVAPDYAVEPLDEPLVRLCGGERLAVPLAKDGGFVLRSATHCAQAWSVGVAVVSLGSRLELVPLP